MRARSFVSPASARNTSHSPSGSDSTASGRRSTLSSGDSMFSWMLQQRREELFRLLQIVVLHLIARDRVDEPFERVEAGRAETAVVEGLVCKKKKRARAGDLDEPRLPFTGKVRKDDDARRRGLGPPPHALDGRPQMSDSSFFRI